MVLSLRQPGLHLWDPPLTGGGRHSSSGAQRQLDDVQSHSPSSMSSPRPGVFLSVPGTLELLPKWP